MLKIKENSKIYIYAPSNAVTGGQECLHQLCDELNNSNKNAFIVYFPDEFAEIPDDYKKYNIKVATTIEDSSENVLVLFEAIYNKLNNFNHIQSLLWWLSVDHFFMMSKHYLSIWDYLTKKPKMLPWLIIWRFGHLIKNKKNYFINNLSIKDLATRENTFHCYQSMYANNFLLNNNFKETYPLEDYINEEFCEKLSFTNKEDIILYNPKKGYKYTKKLINLSNDLTWIPLQNMNRTQMSETLSKSKLYIDFGYHPGKDKIPREAAISGCCIITGRQGSADYFEDIPIPNYFKIDEKNLNYDNVILKIKKTLNDYQNRIKDFNFYHQKIKDSKKVFHYQVSMLFNEKNS